MPNKLSWKSIISVCLVIFLCAAVIPVSAAAPMATPSAPGYETGSSLPFSDENEESEENSEPDDVPSSEISGQEPEGAGAPVADDVPPPPQHDAGGTGVDGSITPASVLPPGSYTIASIFPDSILAGTIASQLGLSVNSAVTQNQLNSITQLNPSGAVHDLEGIQYLNGLREARLDNLQVTQRFPDGFITDIYPNLNFYIANNQRYQSDTIYLDSPSLANVLPEVPPLFIQIAQNSNGAKVGTWNIKNQFGGTIYTMDAYNGNELLGYNLPATGNYNIELLIDNGAWMGLDGSLYMFPVIWDNSATGAIVGTVTSATGAPMAGVTITLKDSGNNIVANATTDANGYYSFTSRATGNYTVTAELNGYYTQTKSATVSDNKTTTVNFTLMAYSGSVIGTVLDAVTLQPVPGALVTPQAPGILPKTTDANGRFYYDYIPSGTYSALVTKTGYYDKTDTQTIQGTTTTEVVIYLDPITYTLSGHVYVEGSGPLQPIPGAVVTLPGGLTATTDANGYYSIANVRPGQYTATAYAEHYGTDQADVNIQANTTQDFYLAPNPGTVTANAYLGSVAPVNGLAGTTFILNSTGATEPLSQTVTSDANGSYSFSLPPGEYTLEASNPGHKLVSTNPVNIAGVVTFTVTADGTATVDFVFEAMVYRIYGTVYEGSGTTTPISGAGVEFSYNGQTYTTLGDGSYVITDVPYGSYLLVAGASGYSSEAANIITDNNENIQQDFHLFQNPATLTGQVYYYGTATPVPGATLTLSDGRYDTTDASGQAAAELVAGTYTATATYNGYTTPSQTITLAPDDNETLIFYVFAATGLTGTVTDASTQQVIPGATVTISGASAGSATTDNGGIYAFDNPTAGRYTITVSAPGYQTVKRTGAQVVAGQVTVEDFMLLPLVNKGILTGTVTYADGLPYAGATITLSSGDVVTTNESGKYSFEVAPNSYGINMQASGFANQNKNDTVINDQTTVVDFVLEVVPGNLTGRVSDESGNPLLGVTIEARSYDNPNGILYRTSTDINGNYSFTGLDPDLYSVVASSPGFGTQGKTGKVVAAGTTVVDFTMGSNPGILEGTVTIEGTTTPIPNATITIMPGNIRITTDANGFYRVPLVAGSYTVTAGKTGFSSQSRDTVITSGQTTTEDFILVEQATSGGGGNNGTGGSPQTGDYSNLLLYVILATVSGLVLLLTMYRFIKYRIKVK